MKTNFALRKIVTLALLLACVPAFTACSLSRLAKKDQPAEKPPAEYTLNRPYPAYDYAEEHSPAPLRSAPDSGLNGVPQYQPRFQGQPYQAPEAASMPMQANPPGTIQQTSAEMPIEGQMVAAQVPMHPVNYVYPYGQAMPPCGPGCRYPNAVCQHGIDPRSCQNCQGAGGAFQAGPCWPEDEYLYDGGDQKIRTEIDKDFGIHGLDIEDTVGHYDTMDGKRIVTPSNRVCVYSPRFAAVRKVTGAIQDLGGDRIAGMDADLQLLNQQNNGTPAGVVQPLALHGNIGAKMANALAEDQKTIQLFNWQKPGQFLESFKAYEDFTEIRYGIFEQGEKPRLSASLQNAVAWTRNQQLQVVLDGIKAAGVDHGDKVHEFVWSETNGAPRLRVIKVADKGAAEAGEIVEFTLRFDNVGDQVMGNVTILDNLTPRLEYVEGSAQCDIDAQFLTQINEAGSQLLHWEIKEPLKAGKGGIIRFKCRVR